jgi:hypothetical protein
MQTQIDFIGDRLRVHFAKFGIEDYKTFLRCKKLPEYELSFQPEDDSYTITAPARFADMLGLQRPASTAGNLDFAEFLFDDQRHLVSTALDAKRFAIWAMCGNGKGLPPATPVLTPNGWRAIGSLLVGEEVVGGDGNPTIVDGVFNRGIQPMFRVRFSDGTETVCDSDHLWPVRKPQDILKKKPWRVISTGDLANTKLKYGTTGQSRTWQVP